MKKKIFRTLFLTGIFALVGYTLNAQTTDGLSKKQEKRKIKEEKEQVELDKDKTDLDKTKYTDFIFRKSFNIK